MEAVGGQQGNERERVLYRGSPSQTVNLKIFIVCIAIFAISMVLPSKWDVIVADMPGLAKFKDQYMLAVKGLFFVPVIWAAVAWMKVSSHKYILTSERLREEEGVLSKSTDELELFRVKDISFTQPFFLRMFGCGNIILDTSDKSTPIVILYAIKKPSAVIDIIRHNVSIMRSKKGVREVD